MPRSYLIGRVIVLVAVLCVFIAVVTVVTVGAVRLYEGIHAATTGSSR